MINYKLLAYYYKYENVEDLLKDYHNGKKFEVPDYKEVEVTFLYYYMTKSEYDRLYWFRMILSYLQSVYMNQIINKVDYERYICRLISGSQVFTEFNLVQINILNKWIESAFDLL